MPGGQDERCGRCDGAQAAAWFRPVARADDLCRIAKAHMIQCAGEEM